MSFDHLISIGRPEDVLAMPQPQPTLVQRVLAYFKPDGLAHLRAPAACSPLTERSTRGP
jgi:hypothetical protein